MRTAILSLCLTILVGLFVAYQSGNSHEQTPHSLSNFTEFNGVLIEKDQKLSVYTCLQNSGYTRAAAVLKWTNNTFAPKNRTAELATSFAIEVVLQLSGYDNLLNQLDTYLAQQSGTNIAKTWIQVRVFDNFKPTCSFVQGALTYLTSKNKPVGVLSSKSEWNNAFGSTAACPELLANVAFWNSTSGALASVRNYTRQTKGFTVTTCGTTFHAFSTD